VLGDGTTTKTARKRVVNEAVKSVAAYLGNTPAVCRASYIDPRVIDRFRAGHTIAELADRPLATIDLAQPRSRERVEAAVLDLLRG
jgi:DNA topoisomerase IB